MPTQTPWARFAIASVALSASIAACDSVLDIQDPKLRPGDAGAGGEPTTGATGGGGSSSGSGGTHGINTPMGGAAAGDTTTTPTTAGGGAGGEGGEPVLTECEPNARNCGGADGRTPQICDQTGHWGANTLEASGDCPNACLDGKCAECNASDPPRCAVCADDATGCNTNQPQKCVAGVWQNDDQACDHYCGQGLCQKPTSCGSDYEVLNTCQNGVSCCASTRVPGGTFFRGFDGSEDFADQIYPASVKPFLLDKFEVTVGRMRPFVLAYDALALTDGQGKSPHIPDDHGWNTAYDLPLDKAALLTQLKCEGGTWSDQNTGNDVPVNCVSFNVAYAFCIWDGGRLPTEAEWNFAAAGGGGAGGQRIYPWADSPNLDLTYANYGTSGPVAVGSSPLGNGLWGQSDLAGNLQEWTLDYNQDYPVPCDDCLITAASTDRTYRGGSYQSTPFYLSVSYRGYADLTDVSPTQGFRCARDLE